MMPANEPSGSQKRLPATVWKLGWVSFFADVSSEMAYPIVPLFMKEVLKAPVAALGLIEGIAEGIVSLFKGWSGWHSDRRGKRVGYVQAGYGLAAIGKPLLALALAWPMVLVARSVDRLGKGLRTTARDALIADAVTPSMRGSAFGLHRAMDTAGALVGVGFLAALTLFLSGNYRLIFLIAFIPGLVSTALTLTVREAHQEKDTTASEPIEPLTIGTLELLRGFPTGYWLTLASLSLFALGNSSDMFLLLFARSEFGLLETQVILQYAAYNLAYMLVSYPAGRLSDRIGRWWLTGVGWAVYVLVYLAFAFSSSAWVMVLFLFYGLYMGLTKGVSSALIADFAPARARGTAMGLFYMVTGMSTVLASVIAGLLWDKIGPRFSLFAGALFAMLGLLLLPLASRASKRSTK